MGSAPEGEDAVQEVLCKLMAPAALAKVADAFDIEVYLRQMFLNAATDAARKKKAAAKAARRYAEVRVRRRSMVWFESREGYVSDDPERNEAITAVRAALKKLSAEDRQVLHL